MSRWGRFWIIIELAHAQRDMANNAGIALGYDGKISPMGLATIVKVSPVGWGSICPRYRVQLCRHRRTAGVEPNCWGHGMQPTASPIELVSSPGGMRILSTGNHFSSRLRFPCSWAHTNAGSVPSRLVIGTLVGLEGCQLSWYRCTQRYRSPVYRVRN
jgi:hypothetical protein